LEQVHIMFMLAGGTVHPTGCWEEQSEASYSRTWRKEPQHNLSRCWL